MAENIVYGPEWMPVTANGEYDQAAVESYLVESFENILKVGFSDELGNSQLELDSYGIITKDYIIDHAAGSYRYTVTRTTDPQYTQYSIEPSIEGDGQYKFENDLMSRVGLVGLYYEKIIIASSGGDYLLIAQRIEDIIENVYIADVETMVENGNIINLLKPAPQKP